MPCKKYWQGSDTISAKNGNASTVKINAGETEYKMPGYGPAAMNDFINDHLIRAYLPHQY